MGRMQVELQSHACAKRCQEVNPRRAGLTRRRYTMGGQLTGPCARRVYLWSGSWSTPAQQPGGLIGRSSGNKRRACQQVVPCVSHNSNLTLPLPATPTLPSLCRARLRWCSIEPSEETPPSADAHSLPVGAGGAWQVLAASAGYWPPPSSARAALGGANTPPEVCSCCGGGAVTTLTPLLPAGGEAGSCSRRDWGAGRGAPAAAAAALASTAVAAD